jgi:uroporphyrin-III C-methyltransferase
MKTGIVYIVGAGPGDPDLISVKGLRAIQRCDVVVYDALIAPELLESAPPGAERVYVGKRAGRHCKRQEEINEILITHARSGKTVVRLKGGDPFVYGRGGEEITALRSAGIEMRIIPGITAGIGVPTSLGIPLTHRGISSGAAFVTGHECIQKKNMIDWHALASIDTVVIYMGLKEIDSIVGNLAIHGRSVDTPAAVIFGGTLPDERVVTGTLATIAERVRTTNTDLPALIVVGEVVRLYREFDDRADHAIAVQGGLLIDN